GGRPSTSSCTSRKQRAVCLVRNCSLKAGLGHYLSKNLERLDPRARTGNKRGLSEPPQGASSAAPVRVRGAAELFRQVMPQACPAPKHRIIRMEHHHQSVILHALAQTQANAEGCGKEPAFEQAALRRLPASVSRRDLFGWAW